MSPNSLSPPPPANVDLQVDDSYSDRVPSQRLLAAVLATLRTVGADDGEVTVVIGSDDLLQQLNRDYRGIDLPTDVLSFSTRAETEAAEVFVTAPEAVHYLGDVVIAFPAAERQAIAAGHSLADELSLLTVHGVLHLLGYDHATEEQEADMWARQAAILQDSDFSRP